VSGATDRFIEAARGQGLEPMVRRFPQGTKTAADAAAAIGCDVAQIVKSLVFMAGNVPVLALTSGANRVDLEQLSAVAEAPVRRATPDEARVATGFAVGGTPPFGHPGRVPTFLDEDLLRHDELWAAAGTPDSVFPLSSGDLLRVSGAHVARIAERP
jgi:prolyl-tRNA editing enzyme YbaK/EbsC (Cys-tRNA(Pro) deacylase)